MPKEPGKPARGAYPPLGRTPGYPSNGWLDGDKAMLEMLLSIKRAGAKIILSYFAKEFAILKNY